MSQREKNRLNGNSSQSGKAVHAKTYGHVKAVADTMFGKDSSKLPWAKPPSVGGTTKLKYSKRGPRVAGSGY